MRGKKISLKAKGVGRKGFGIRPSPDLQKLGREIYGGGVKRRVKIDTCNREKDL